MGVAEMRLELGLEALRGKHSKTKGGSVASKMLSVISAVYCQKMLDIMEQED